MEIKTKYKILFVCTQNVFRSMSAHYLSEKYLKENGINDFEIDSCGTVAYSWESPYQHTLDLLQTKGIDVRSHKNKQISKKLVVESQYIICMTNDHKKNILKTFGVKPYLFNELALGKNSDLQDDNEADFSCSLNNFIENTISHIDKNIPNIFEVLLKKINQN
jgi:protein-tyrosine-phosphatase